MLLIEKNCQRKTEEDYSNSDTYVDIERQEHGLNSNGMASGITFQL